MKWEYKVVQYQFIIGTEDQQHMNELGEKSWKLIRQAEYKKPHDVVCTFRRPKGINDSTPNMLKTLKLYLEIFESGTFAVPINIEHLRSLIAKAEGEVQ